MPSRATIATILCGVTGALFVIVGVSLIYIFQNMIHEKIKEQVKLVENTTTYDDWVNPPVPIYFQVWVFDIVNHDEVVKNGDKPSLVQKGPYTYREHREKVNITFNDDSTVTYREDRSFVFDRNKSVGDESDTFTTISIPMLTVVNMIRFEFGIIQEAINLILEAFGENLFITLSVEDILWGYEDALLKEANSLLEKFANKSIDDRFGLFYNQNNSDDGLYTIHTGVNDSSLFGLITSWNNYSSLPYWTTDLSNMLNGTDGTIFPPFVDSSKRQYLFSSDICRSIYTEYNYTYSLKQIDLQRYVAPASVFLDEQENPYNAGFCTPSGQCLPSGLMNVSACREGAPVVLSQPHFLAADKSVIDGVEGLNPNTEEHQTYLDIEPMTGVAMNVAKKLQINVFLQPIDHISATQKIKPVFLPILWLNESASIDDKTANVFHNEVQEPIKITEAVQFGLISLGVFILICVIVVIITKNVGRQQTLSVQDEDQASLLPS